MTDLPRSARRVRESALDLGLDVEVIEMPASTRTAREAADACGCGLGQIVKSLIFTGAKTGRPYLFLVSGTNRVNEADVAHELGEALKRPDADFVRTLTGYAIGGVPPFGHASPLTTHMDLDLMQYDVIWAAAGTPKCLFSVAPDALREATGARLLRVT